MKKYFAQLRPMERRLLVGVAVVVIIVLNAVFIWPHFSDWGDLQRRLGDAQRKLNLYQTALTQTNAVLAQVKKFENEGESVAPEDQGVDFMRTVQAQSAQSSVTIFNTSRQLTRTNDSFFVEQSQNIDVIANDEQLVDFLYKLGSGSSMIRVRDLELQTDPPRQHLSAKIKLVANYQKNPKSAPAASASKAKAK